MNLYEYVVVAQEGDKLTLLTKAPILTTAPDYDTVQKRAIRDIPLPDEISIDQVSVIVRAFVGWG